MTEHQPLRENNPRVRALFVLPPAQESGSTQLAVPTMPEAKAVTGDRELDAVLWLREVVKTGDPALIAKAREAAATIKTPAQTLEKRYARHLLSTTGNTMAAAFGSFDFADIDKVAERELQRQDRLREGRARFGTIEQLFKDTPAEKFCKKALRGLKLKSSEMSHNEGEAAARFIAETLHLPHTLEDALFELAYWHALYVLRTAANAGDEWPAVYSRQVFVLGHMANIPPRTTYEAQAVLKYLQDGEYMNSAEAPAILLNLVKGPRCSP